MQRVPRTERRVLAATVNDVAQDRMADRGQVSTDLVTHGVRGFELEQYQSVFALDDAKARE
ncbi:MAG TPA: hypothetical protein VGP93_08185, partial [Polyangiaceae bacterium]|nr:hypothetical protein [Polyangiaceae bacterium]